MLCLRYSAERQRRGRQPLLRLRGVPSLAALRPAGSCRHLAASVHGCTAEKALAPLLAALPPRLPKGTKQFLPLRGKRDVAAFRAFQIAFVETFSTLAGWDAAPKDASQWKSMKRTLSAVTQTGSRASYAAEAERRLYVANYINSRPSQLSLTLALSASTCPRSSRPGLGHLRKVVLDSSAEPLRVLSLGGGPGFDAIGLAAFLTYHAAATGAATPSLVEVGQQWLP
eukprot:TRINITY_DN39733_c0_g1_i3.p1 TRINITY_DN39733_c0_g1~~TRINITY_DN39733_c0_g1_i3.p1  ORF type:complete len:227 (-),score=45.14 TRINITY_DN39733_c0_g1_i3:468-1148(-)